MSIVDAVRGRVSGQPSHYERAWLVSVNAVGLVVVLGVLLDSRLLLGTGQSGIFQRALYPLAPPAATLGVALAGGNRRGAVLSALALVTYVGVLVVVGTLPAAVSAAPGYPLAGLVGTALLVTVGYVWRHSLAARV